MNKRQPNEVPAALKNIDVKAILRRRGIFAEQSVNKELKDSARVLAKKLVQGKHTPVSKAVPQPISVQFDNDIITSYWQKQLHMVDVVEAKFEEKIRQFIGKMEKGYLATFELDMANLKTAVKKDYFTDFEDELLTMAQLDFTPLLNNIAVLAGQEAYKLLGTTDVYLLENIRKRVEANVKLFTESMIDTDRAKMVDIISNGIATGQSIPQIRGEVQASFDGMKASQAQMISRTEVLRASNQAQLDAYTQSGIVEAQQWLATDPCPECAPYDGEVVALDASFYSSDNIFADGEPPLHPNCRCVLIPVLIDAEKTYSPDNKDLYQRIFELESQIDKRTKEYKEMKAKQVDDALYVKSLEKYLNIEDE